MANLVIPVSSDSVVICLIFVTYRWVKGVSELLRALLPCVLLQYHQVRDLRLLCHDCESLT